MTRIIFRASGFEIDTKVDDGHALGYRWWRTSISRGFYHQTIYCVVIGAVSTGHHIVADELGTLRLCTSHELFPILGGCGEHGAAEHAAAAIAKHAVQPSLLPVAAHG
tara:strand:+ start:18092 stop:18415 length:324 start_codon:yes stop_codon:yes gene_type:complete